VSKATQLDVELSLVELSCVAINGALGKHTRISWYRVRIFFIKSLGWVVKDNSILRITYNLENKTTISDY